MDKIQENFMQPCVVLKHPESGTNIYLLGTSHISSFYGFSAYELIKNVNPQVVFLEVDKERYDQAEYRGYLWLSKRQTSELVKTYTKHFKSGWNAQYIFNRNRLVQLLQQISNEGGAALEGGVYGSEVVLAASAAVQLGAQVVFGDRPKRVGDERLRERLKSGTFKSLFSDPNVAAEAASQLALKDDISDNPALSLLAVDSDQASTRILHRASQRALSNFKTLIEQVQAGWECTQGRWFARRLHPIFQLPESPAYHAWLEQQGVHDVAAVAQAVRRILDQGVLQGGVLQSADLLKVRRVVLQIEQQKYVARHHLLAESVQQQAQAAASQLDSADGASPPLGLYIASSIEALPILPAQYLATAAQVQGLRDLASCLITARHNSEPLYRWLFQPFTHHVQYPKAERAPLTRVPAMMDPDSAYTSEALNELYYQTVVHERDLIMAANLYDEARKPGVERVVAVVGANHVPGIVAQWARAGLPSTREQYHEYMQPVPKECSEQLSQTGHRVWRTHMDRVDSLAQGIEGGVFAGVFGGTLFGGWKLQAALARVWPQQRGWAGSVGRTCGRAGVMMSPLVGVAGLILSPLVTEIHRAGQAARLLDNLAATNDCISNDNLLR